MAPVDLFARRPAAEHRLDHADMPAKLDYFVPGHDSVTLPLAPGVRRLAVVGLDDGCCGLMDGQTLLLVFPGLDKLPVGDIFLRIGEDQSVCALADFHGRPRQLAEVEG